MRKPTLFLLPSLFVACQSTAPEATPRSAAAAVEAALRASVSPRDVALAVPEAEVRAVDPQVAALLKATFRDYSVRQKVALENLANLHTTAYKRRVVVTAPRPSLGSDGSPVPVPTSEATYAVFTTGPLLPTGRMLDVAIDGDGFFSVITSNGSYGYTRDGRLHVNRDGKLVTTQGFVLVPEITIPCDALEISIDPNGRVSGRTAGSPDTSTSFGDLAIHRLINPEGLLSDGTVWREADAAGSPLTGAPGSSGLGLLEQGCLEGSNVQFGDETIELQVLERQHEALTQVMQRMGLIAP